MKNYCNTNWARVLFFVIIGLLSVSIVYAHGISDSDKQSMLDGGYLDYIYLGASHMITGYDHLLFLFGVIFYLTKFKEIVKFITAFTVGHSITLIFATFMEITANYFLVDAVIALTVIYKGFDNLDGFKHYFQMKSPNLMAMVFSFGLIHGFGLSTRLQQLPLGDDGLLLKIISFNVGVELGQIAALTIMLFGLTFWRKTESFNRFSTASNFGLICAGVFLFLMQMHGYSHQFEAEQTTTDPVVQTSQWQDTTTINIPAGEGLEHKFYMMKNARIEYEWSTNGGDLYFDFHGEVKGEHSDLPEDHEESYLEGTSNQSSGSVKVPFEGSHGWWWKNNTTNELVITLHTNGVYEIIGNPDDPVNTVWRDSVTINVPAGKGLEYKFYMMQGAPLEYEWSTNGGELYFDLHGEIINGNSELPEDHEESYQEGTSNESSGSVNVPFEGSHGWWWKNNTVESIKITLKTKGNYKIIGLLR